MKFYAILKNDTGALVLVKDEDQGNNHAPCLVWNPDTPDHPALHLVNLQAVFKWSAWDEIKPPRAVEVPTATVKAAVGNYQQKG